PLRDPAAASKGRLVLVRPGRAWRLRGNQNKDTPLPPEEPRGENPPDGAILDYVLPPAIAGPVTLEIADAAGAVVRRFSSDDPEEKIDAEVYFSDRFLAPRGAPGGAPGSRLLTTEGHHRFIWNLRYDRPRALAYE